MIDELPTHVDLFSGIGGFALAAQWAGFRTIAFCEIDKYCQKVLAKNFGAKVVGDSGEQPARGKIGGSSSWKQGVVESDGRTDSRIGFELPSETLADTGRECVSVRREAGDMACSSRTPEANGEQRERMRDSSGDGRPTIHSNIFELDGSAYRGCDLLTGGFPCQPFSVAGKRRGAADDRALWPEMFRVIKEARPAWVLGENVPGIIPMELDNVLSDLEGIGYACRPFVIPACAVDAKHRRDRLWIVGRRGGIQETRGNGPFFSQRDSEMADAEGRIERAGLCEDESAGLRRGRSGDGDSSGVTWLAEPDVGRVAHGIPSRVDRLKGLGNAIVPQVAYEILREIRKLTKGGKE
jgi:DNA (cytosine-5)-methyltransferase 1